MLSLAPGPAPLINAGHSSRQLFARSKYAFISSSRDLISVRDVRAGAERVFSRTSFPSDPGVVRDFIGVVGPREKTNDVARRTTISCPSGSSQIWTNVASVLCTCPPRPPVVTTVRVRIFVNETTNKLFLKINNTTTNTVPENPRQIYVVVFFYYLHRTSRIKILSFRSFPFSIVVRKFIRSVPHDSFVFRSISSLYSIHR